MSKEVESLSTLCKRILFFLVAGFSTVDQACCGVPIGPYHGLTPCFPGVAYCANRGQHLFWDPYHPTDAANVIIANRFFTGPPADIYPINIKALAALSMD
jgi:hypothetical protein